MEKWKEAVNRVKRKLWVESHALLPYSSTNIFFVGETKDWAINSMARNIQNSLSFIQPNVKFVVRKSYVPLRTNLLHFGSQFTFENWQRFVKNYDKITLSYFHGKFGQSREIDRNLNYLIQNYNFVDSIAVSNLDMQNYLTSLRIPESKVKLVPIGVSTDTFRPRSMNEFKLEEGLLEKLEETKGRVVVGSFQKDGMGWRSGNSPKMIKGPDILVEVLIKLSQIYPLSVLLTGPARGYVLNKLKSHNIHFLHFPNLGVEEIAYLYTLLDLYLVTSREEGGPMSLLEALASGCPVVTTPVGMAKDIDRDLYFYRVVNSFDQNEIVSASIEILNKSRSDFNRFELRNLVCNYDWNLVSYNFTRALYPV